MFPVFVLRRTETLCVTDAQMKLRVCVCVLVLLLLSSLHTLDGSLPSPPHTQPQVGEVHAGKSPNRSGCLLISDWLSIRWTRPGGRPRPPLDSLVCVDA